MLIIFTPLAKFAACRVWLSKNKNKNKTKRSPKKNKNAWNKQKASLQALSIWPHNKFLMNPASPTRPQPSWSLLKERTLSTCELLSNSMMETIFNSILQEDSNTRSVLSLTHACTIRHKEVRVYVWRLTRPLGDGGWAGGGGTTRSCHLDSHSAFDFCPNFLRKNSIFVRGTQRKQKWNENRAMETCGTFVFLTKWCCLRCKDLKIRQNSETCGPPMCHHLHHASFAFIQINSTLFKINK